MKTHLRIHAIAAGGYAITFFVAFVLGVFADAVPLLMCAVMHTYIFVSLTRPRSLIRYHRRDGYWQRPGDLEG